MKTKKKQQQEKKTASKRRPARRPSSRRRASGPTTLALDVGGNGLKASVLDPAGRMLVERMRVKTPRPGTPEAIVGTLVSMAEGLIGFDRVSVGFPGVVRQGVVRTAPNLDQEAWPGYGLREELERRLGKPVRAINDADMQGLGCVEGRGIEMVITLGTGFGTALFQNGHLGPHLEIAHIPFRKGETYDQQLGDRTLKAIGTKKWLKRVREAIDNMRTLTLFDHLYVGGGNSRLLPDDLGDDVSSVSNDAGLTGGIRLWDEREECL